MAVGWARAACTVAAELRAQRKRGNVRKRIIKRGVKVQWCAKLTIGHGRLAYHTVGEAGRARLELSVHMAVDVRVDRRHENAAPITCWDLEAVPVLGRPRHAQLFGSAVRPCRPERC